MTLRSLLAAAVVLAGSAAARTDLVGCTYYDSIISPTYYAPYNTRIWYVPGTGELCDFLDCGGGRAPPKTTVPGCAAYEGTGTYSPSFLDLKTLPGAAGGSGSGAPSPKTTAAGTAGSPSTLETRTTAAAQGTETASASTGSGAGSETDETQSAEDAPKETAAAATITSKPEPSASKSTGSSSDSVSSSTAAAPSDSTGGAAALSGGAVLGSCLAAGVAACMYIM